MLGSERGPVLAAEEFTGALLWEHFKFPQYVACSGSCLAVIMDSDIVGLSHSMIEGKVMID